MLSAGSTTNSAKIDSTPNSKGIACRFCERRFRKKEHVQRHERIHTKERPFQCECGHSFSRRDLLSRHDRLVHLPISDTVVDNSTNIQNDSQGDVHYSITVLGPRNGNGGIPRPTSPIPAPRVEILGAVSNNRPDKIGLGDTRRVLSDGIEPLASDGRLDQETTSQEPSCDESMGQLLPETQGVLEVNMQLEDPDINQMLMDGQLVGPGRQGQDMAIDYNMFLDDFGLGGYIFADLGAEFPASVWSRPLLPDEPDGNRILDQPLPARESGLANQNPFSSFDSRLPSMQPEAAAPSADSRSQFFKDFSRAGARWTLTALDHASIQHKVEEFSNVLPQNYSLPSRYTLSRFLDGFIGGLNEHFPFIHTPTISTKLCAPELLLALAASGATYKFEGRKGIELWGFAKSIALEQVRRRNVQRGDAPSPGSTHRFSSSGVLLSRSDALYCQIMGNKPIPRGNVPEGINNESMGTSQDQLQTTQALLVLMIMGTWSAGALLREAFTLRSLVALLIKDEWLDYVGVPSQEQTWEHWIAIECQKRTKFVAYCFFNLQCIAYDLPPLILSSEVRLSLPHSAEEWKAETAEAWLEIRRKSPPSEVLFQEALSNLFAKSNLVRPISSFGNYILISALIQQIFFIRQTSELRPWKVLGHGLDLQDIDELGHALRTWEASWEASLESSLNPSSPNGPVAFNSTALLRLGYIRLHTDLGPCRKLDSHDPVGIAAALMKSPELSRTPQLTRAVLQSAHALSIPVKLGIEYVARTQTLSWSIQHSLCNLECAFLLSKWLLTIAMSDMDLSEEESILLEMVRSMLDETQFVIEFEREGHGAQVSDRMRIRHLAAAIVCLWAEIFNGTHIFEIVKVIAESLEQYGLMLKRLHTEIQ